MNDLVLAITPSTPEQEITGLSLRARVPFSHAGVILILRDTRNGLLQSLADGILRQTGAVETTARRTFTSTAAPNIGKTLLCLCGSDDIFSSAGGATATTPTFGGDIALTTSFEIVVGYITVVGGLVPDVVAENISTRGLAGDLDVLASLVCLHRCIAGSRSRATIDIVTGDGVGTDSCNGCREGEGNQRGDMHVLRV